MKVHIAGIGGEGWSWIAKVLIEKGWDVSGCDISENNRILDLKKLGFKDFKLGNSPSHIKKDLDAFLYTSAIKYNVENKKELDKALEVGVKSYERNEFLPILLNDRDIIAISGTHGKTTTTSMVAYLIDALGDKCGFGIGGTSLNLKTNGRNGESKNFVIEADEFADAFLGLNPKLAVITSLEMDHHDYFPDFDLYVNSFCKFVSNVKPDGTVLMWGDETPVEKFKSISTGNFMTYGESKSNDIVISEIEINGFETSWNFEIGKNIYNAKVLFPGKQYAFDATAALVVCMIMGFDINDAISKLNLFKGTGRRFQSSVKNGITVVNDYGHHPTEIKVTVNAAKSTGKHVIVIYEPHQYKRCAELLNEFGGVFSGIDLIQCPIYASRENPPYPITNEDFFNVTKSGTVSSILCSSLDEAISKTLEKSKKNDLILVLAVGHGDFIVHSLLERI
ncbi:hypothetical protein CO058_03650 [candidate division WWE3 bacterium CG_4_9_14_0_2_um_filter_35_11]|uniref:UDP-N-acetylmuramate--L-alanine ligase n=1 Tax=candidate division WWE3 bacterium CG_4_9_14_0_2_um_filter_35_11 TaxID=1975077 RepID=A0A2M8EL21_UNCKA|nr:MAG: hypothetical protein COV25_02350 [candidate division WWE3 bacterium CG10_big_fil_rev_8_21_14_0_10_35_32]PJC23397.1 MAG: hypothetical protein CO058_03650 [candidate division WWE3 bacterium CG_4_9_14_0_2_um_filter_35_11]